MFVGDRQRSRRFACGEQGNRVGVVLEAGGRSTDVVGDNQVEFLALELATGVGLELIGLGGEADQGLTDRLAGTQPGEYVGGGLEHDLGNAFVLLELAVRSIASCICAAVSTETTSTPGGTGRSTVETSVTAAPLAAATSAIA
jgi:hypothetical protein